ncbi:MAG: hypothetical protein DRP93_05470 [Candidatus Neomarinimicrobiota bacterium]|nr:MAG: hypothetical protein DRP93_05470 [Candidatus Neomarinimicrobiota bacterium]
MPKTMPENTEGVKKALIMAFKCYGMPKVIHSDNGSPFGARFNISGLSQLSVRLISRDINIHFSRPDKPRDSR